MRRALLLLPLLLALPVGLWALDRALPPDLSRFEAVSAEIPSRDGRLLHAIPVARGTWRLRTAPEDAPPHLLAQLLRAEDARFPHHPGVDPLALARAASQWARTGRVVSGGSTLSMQTARLLEPRPRTLRSKAIEALRALQLEWRLGKPGVLSVWLTLAPQGGNLEGLRAGALAWFGRPLHALDPAETALLLALARQPARARPDRHPEAARIARDAVLHQRAPGLATPAEIAHAALPTRRHPLPRHAPLTAMPTLDLDLQRGVTALAREALDRLPPQVSIAIAVMEIETGEFRALFGGDWNNPVRAGHLDLTRAVRSPGSALKPLVYALGFEAGLARPDTLLDDLPRRFGTYAPENFDRAFAGRLSVADALRQSLNGPAVAMLEAVGPVRMATAMKRAGATPRLPPGAVPTLPLALGGVGITLRELVTLYARLPETVERRAAEAALAALVQPFGGPAGIAWKTGTSWGGRDAWAVGLDRRHAVGIWVGRPDGTAMPGATGARLALPVLTQVFERLPAAPRAPLPARPAAAPALAGTDALRLVFPPPGAALAEAGRVVIRAGGGQRPLSFLVDGAPIPSDPARREAAWTPPGPGRYRLSVLDAGGAAVGVELRVR
ncbi:transglycosylase domain-containing protein [Sabulicella rubraurantiaca]|uniref:transglycosylase domain-containing protein n=1 Tax=Sabulicella rubraurantiaca TaxID=2811429 RepID=UPI001A96E825|nr:transglycosylase domain-containing protein [Sabulicella rubraurantiaca]